MYGNMYADTSEGVRKQLDPCTVLCSPTFPLAATWIHIVIFSGEPRLES